MDREIGASPVDAGFRADPDERLDRAPTAPSWGRAGRWLAVTGAFALHALFVLLVILEYRWNPQSAPQAEEIPVEIVVEPQQPKPPEPPPPPAPSPEPTPQTKPLDLEAAHDAPRAANDEKVERPAPDEKTKAPTREDTAKAPGEESAPEKPDQPSRQSEAQPVQQPPQPTPDKAADASDGDLDANSESPDAEAARAAAQAPAQKVATFVGQPLPNWSKGGSFSTFDQVPDVDFGSAAEQTAIAGGKAKKTYLTLLYGMIMAHVHYAASGHAREGEIVFIVDGKGNLLQRQIARPSGSMELDAAALGAVAEAAPFPAPPTGSAVRLRFTYGAH
ncbi:MAG TPA: TonB family protein [Roseiarcus sp.]